MDLIKLNDYIPPAPSTYDVDYTDVNGEESGLEDGTTYIEQIRADVPKIKVGWTNLKQEDVDKIIAEVSDATVAVQYYFGTVKTATMTKSDRALRLKAIDNAGNHYWDLSFTLEG